MHGRAIPLNSAENSERMSDNAAIPKVDWNVDPAVWVDEHGDFLFRFALFRLRDETAAEDAVQEAPFLRSSR